MKLFKKAAVLAIASALLLAACSKNESAQSAASGTSGKTYIVAIDGTYAPFEFIQDDKIIGFSRDVLDAVAEKEGMKFEYRNTPWEAIFATLTKGDSDIVSASVTITDERKQSFDFTDPYFEAAQLIITPADKAGEIKSMADLKDRRVSVMNGTTGSAAVEKIQGTQSSLIKRFENMPLALKELVSGGADASVGDNGVVKYFIANHPDSKFNTVLDPSFEKEYYGFVLRKGREDDLMKKMNAGIAAIKADGTYQKIHDKWFGDAAAQPAAGSAASAAGKKS